MIRDLPSTTSSAINKAMVDLREKGGTVILGRVLTLVIVVDEDSAEAPIAAANAASFEHPCRVIVVAQGSKRGAARMDAQIRVGGDAGASEVVVLRLFGPLAGEGASVVMPLLLPDAPVVAWWPGGAPDLPADDPIGRLAQRRITDAASASRPTVELGKRPKSYRPGDTDLAWTRLTQWRGLLAAALDQPPHEKITEATVTGASDSASTELMAGWLALQLRCPVRRTVIAKPGSGLHSVLLTRRSSSVALIRPETVTATLNVTHQPERSLSLPRRGLRDCIAEELRRLDSDDVYAEVLAKGLPLIQRAGPAKSTDVRPAVTGSSPAAGRKPPAAANGPAKSPAKSPAKTAAKGTAKSPAGARKPAKSPAKKAGA